MDEEKRKQIESTILAAFDRWSIRNNEKYIQEQRGLGKQKEDSGERARQDGLFLTKRVFAPGFDRYVVKVMHSNPVVASQSRVMLKSCLISIMKEEGAKTEDVIRKVPQASASTIGDTINAPQYVVRRQFQRYRHKDFTEMMFPITDDMGIGKTMGDERFSYFSTVFAPTPLPKSENTDDAEAFLEIDRVQSFSNPGLIKRMTLDSLLRLITPEYVGGLLEFQKECLGLLQEIGERGETARILTEEFSKFSLSLGVFYAHFQSILGVYWYRRQKPVKKKELMARGFPLHYSKGDAERIAPLLVALTGSEEWACRVMVDGAACLFEYSLCQSHDHIMNKCLSMTKVPKHDQAAFAENAAVLHRSRNNFERTLHYAKRAKVLSIEASDAYLACICFRDIGEAEWNMGMHKEAIESFAQSEEVLESLDGKHRFGVYFNLASGCRRMRNDDLELGYLKKALKFADDTDNVNAILEVDRRLGELLSRR